MAGSSSDLFSIKEMWVTIADCENLPGLPTSKNSQYTRNAIRKRLDCKAKRIPGTKRKAVGKGKALEYRADLLPLQAQRALLGMPQDSHTSPAQPNFDFLSEISIHSDNLLFSCPAEMVDDGLNLLSVLNRLVASNGHFVRDDLSRALDLAEGLIRAGNSLSKTEGGAA
ncbi:MAG: DNA-binding protein [Aeromonas veronii]